MGWPILLALAWCVLALGFQILSAKRLGRKPLFAPAAGSPASGVRYAFTGAMLPQAKESVRRAPLSYAAGMTFHAGVAAAALGRVLPNRVLAVLALAGAAAGLALLGKRLAKPQLRGLSLADDFVSNVLATGFAALGGAAAFAPAAARVLPWWTCALLVYVPLGKLRHCAFFFLSRYHLGLFFGRRGTFPPATQEP
jgi:hypothetical protein